MVAWGRSAVPVRTTDGSAGGVGHAGATGLAAGPNGVAAVPVPGHRVGPPTFRGRTTGAGREDLPDGLCTASAHEHAPDPLTILGALHLQVQHGWRFGEVAASEPVPSGQRTPGDGSAFHTPLQTRPPPPGAFTHLVEDTHELGGRGSGILLCHLWGLQGGRVPRVAL